MKIAATLLITFFAASEAKNLRAHQQTRRLEDGNADTDAIDDAIKKLLPTVNDILGDNIEDPINIDPAESRTRRFTLDDASSACNGNKIKTTANITQVKGTSNFELEYFTVQEGTEEYDGDCWGAEADFSGTFDYKLSASTLTGVGSVIATDNGGVCVDYESDATLTVTNVVYTGTANASGKILCSTAVFESLEILTIEGTCDDISTVFAVDPPSSFATVQAEIIANIETEAKTYLENDVADLLSGELNKVTGSRFDLGFMGGIPDITALYQASVQQKINNMVGATTAQVAKIQADANAQIANMNARVASAIADAETNTANAVNNLGDNINNKLAAWGDAATAQISSIQANANARIENTKARAADGVANAESSAANAVNGAADALTGKLSAWGEGATNFVGKYGVQIGPGSP